MQKRKRITVRASRKVAESARQWRLDAMHEALAQAKHYETVADYYHAGASDVDKVREAKQRRDFYYMRYARLWEMLS